MIKTAFEQDDDNNNSPLFTNFENYRSIIKGRLDAANSNGEYDINSQEVVIPAFRAAYGGEDPNTIEFSPFPKFPTTGFANILSNFCVPRCS